MAAACTSDLFDVLMIQYGIFDQQAQRRTFALAQGHDVGILGDPLPPAHLEQLTQRFGHLDGQCLWPKRD